MNKQILRLAGPSIISNITVPLLGLVDVAITGHLGAAAYIGAIAVGGMIFNMLYWSFGFLRMGTSGLTAQAYGRGDESGQLQVLVQSVVVGLSVAICLLLLFKPIEFLIFKFVDASPEVAEQAGIYYRIVLWGAPAMLTLYGFKGWFIGMQNTKYPMFIAIAVNIVNILASLILVYLFDMQIKGVAFGTVIAQYAGIIMAIILWFKRYGYMRGSVRWGDSLTINKFRRFFSVNGAIFFRTWCLIAVTVFFTWAGGKQGENVLAVNTLLMQLFTIFSYILDGFAYAGESLIGRYTGAEDKRLVRSGILHLFGWATMVMVVFTTLYAIWGGTFLSLLTDNSTVLTMADSYFYWVLAVPLCGYAAFMWDGILIGATATKEMLAAMFTAAVVFFMVFYLVPIISYFGCTDISLSHSDFWNEPFNNGRLWLAFLLYLVTRGVMQTLFPGLKLLKAK